jgi:NAD(P)-dependent dehydrogenase (short-subunit alcohol dehydrogenase family)
VLNNGFRERGGGSVQRKVAIVTGASQGTGAGLVAAYRRHGFAVVACSRSLTAAHDSGVLAFAGDHADPGTARRIVDAAVAHFGRVDTLIHDAGVFMPKPFTMHSPQDYVLTTGDKMSGFFHLTQRVITQMLHQGDGGHVVTMTPTRARHAYVNIPSALAAITEGGLIAATTSLAKEYARSGIRVNAVSPCVIGTPAHSDDSAAALAVVHPRRQFGVIDEVVRAVLYLEAASHVTGEVLHLDGGHLAGR